MTERLRHPSAYIGDTRHRDSIVVALADVPTNNSAVLWAAGRATTSGQPITLVHAIPDAGLMPSGTSYGDIVLNAREVLERAASSLALSFPNLRVRSYLYCGDIVEGLLGLAGTSTLLVLGADRMDPDSGEYRGSVGIQVALNSVAPVVIVPLVSAQEPTANTDHRKVVVGVDGSDMSYVALISAAGEAQALQAELQVVTASGPGGSLNATESASAVLVDVRRRYPDLLIASITDEDHPPTAALTLQAADAALLVIGRHGKGARDSMFLGSVTHTLLLNPPCPTLILTRRALDQ